MSLLLVLFLVLAALPAAPALADGGSGHGSSGGHGASTGGTASMAPMETVHASYLDLTANINDLRSRVEQWQKGDEGSLGVAQEKLDRLQALVGHTVWPKAMALSVSKAGGALAAKRFNGDSYTGNFAKFGYAIIPLDIAAHIGHNLYHLLAEGKAVAYTALPLVGQAAPDASPALVSIPVIQTLQFILLVLGALGSLYAVYRIAKSQYGQGKTWGSLGAYGALVTVLVALNVWLFVLPTADDATRGVQGQVVKAQDGGLLGLLPTEQGPHASQQHFEGKGFDHIVIGSRL